MTVARFKYLILVVERATNHHEASKKRLSAIWSQFSEGVRNERKLRKISLETLAERLGIKKSQLSYLETNRRSWTLDLAKKAVEVLGE